MPSKEIVASLEPAGLLTLDRAVAELEGAVALGTLRDWIKRGRLVAYRPGKRVLIRRADLLALIESHPVQIR